ncbi:MAG: hypothetical protein RR894_03985 [Terrisporobacter sp.]
MLAEIYAKEKNSEKTLVYIEKMIESYSKEFNFNGHLLFNEIELFEGIHSKSYVFSNLKKILIDEKYDFLREEESYKDIVNKLEQLS